MASIAVLFPAVKCIAQVYRGHSNSDCGSQSSGSDLGSGCAGLSSQNGINCRTIPRGQMHRERENMRIGNEADCHATRGGRTAIEPLGASGRREGGLGHQETANGLAGLNCLSAIHALAGVGENSAIWSVIDRRR